jgi:hypothetical protein
MGFFMKYMGIESSMMLAASLMQNCPVFLEIKHGIGSLQDLRILLKFKVNYLW